MITNIQIAVHGLVFISFECIPEVQLSDPMIILRLILEEHHIVFHCSCAVFHSRQGTKVPVSPCALRCVVFFRFDNSQPNGGEVVVNHFYIVFCSKLVSPITLSLIRNKSAQKSEVFICSTLNLHSI